MIFWYCRITHDHLISLYILVKINYWCHTRRRLSSLTLCHHINGHVYYHFQYNKIYYIQNLIMSHIHVFFFFFSPMMLSFLIAWVMTLNIERLLSSFKFLNILFFFLVKRFACSLTPELWSVLWIKCTSIDLSSILRDSFSRTCSSLIFLSSLSLKSSFRIGDPMVFR